jgi:NhaP-type Na+/H+ or K+/H+ antiporter
VLGTLLIQGLTLRPLLQLLRLPSEDIFERELGLARQGALTALLGELDGDGSPAARRLFEEYREALDRARRGADPRDTAENGLRRRVTSAGRREIERLRSAGTIGDQAYRRVEEELDLMELNAQATEAQG